MSSARHATPPRLPRWGPRHGRRRAQLEWQLITTRDLHLDRRLIEREPVDPELPCRFDELGEIDRLAHEAVRTEVVALDDVALLVARCQHHHRQASRSRIRTNAPE